MNKGSAPQDLRGAPFLLSSFGDDLDPVSVRVLDEINAHLLIFKTDTAHFFVLFVSARKIVRREREMKFAFP